MITDDIKGMITKMNQENESKEKQDSKAKVNYARKSKPLKVQKTLDAISSKFMNSLGKRTQPGVKK